MEYLLWPRIIISLSLMRHRKKSLKIPISIAYWVRNLSSLIFSRVFLHTTRARRNNACDRNRKSYKTLGLGMNLCSWCPERHKKANRDNQKSGRIAMSRHTNSRIYFPQQMRAMSACFELTQGDLESEYDNTPFLSSLTFLFSSLFQLTCVLRAYA